MKWTSQFLQQNTGSENPKQRDFNIDDFKPAGMLRARAAGLANCQTPEFNRRLFQFHAELRANPTANPPDKILYSMVTFTALRLCSDDEPDEQGRVFFDGDAAGLTEFVKLNRERLTDLFLLAFA